MQTTDWDPAMLVSQRRTRNCVAAVIAGTTVLIASVRIGRSTDENLPVPPQREAIPSFEDDISPILKAYCWRCHGGEARKADLDLRSFALLAKGGLNGPVIVSHDVAQSRLYQKVAAGKMPPGDRLKPTQAHLELIRRWIETGAMGGSTDDVPSSVDDPLPTEVDRDWWAFQEAVRPAVPRVAGIDRVRNPIDAFLLERLEHEGLSFSAEADRGTLIVRLYLDVIGLPPDPGTADAFAVDPAPDAWERLVDNLLASPHYGERWGRHWLDAAGYVDAVGTDNDATIIEERIGNWQYRDYVVRSLNDDKPYDQFLAEQIAGDELADWRNRERFTPRDRELLIATGFLRQAADVTYAPELNTADIRHQVLYDTLQIFSSNVLGMTLHCARCHDHKFDPISQADYFRLAALFTPAYNVHDWKHSKDRVLADVSPRQQQAIDEHNTEVDRKTGELKSRITELRRPFEENIRRTKLAELDIAVRDEVEAALATPAANRSDDQKRIIDRYEKQLSVQSDEIDQALDERAREKTAELHVQINELQSTSRSYGTIQALWDIGPPPPAYVYRRGNFQNPESAVSAGVPRVLGDPQRPFEIPTRSPNRESSGYRTALARWLSAENHPLTARVIVNRIWQHYFGQGLVATPGNFGISGLPPTHPELLDWLATEFVQSGWSFKHLHRLILTSSAYRQASRRSPNDSQDTQSPEEVDPENQLLWRMRLKRLESEIIRDRVIATAGLLNPSMGGPPIPLKAQHDGTVEIDSAQVPSAARRNRRSLYIFARRNYQLTELLVFDQPSVALNCTHRTQSAVVLQSLTMLNSKFLFEQAAQFAVRVEQIAGNDGRRRVEHAFRFALCRKPSAEELALGQRLLQDQTARYVREQNLSQAAASDPALTELCHMLFNANEFLYAP